MFELGMRLAFDKPTVIIKDDQTDYSFDTGVIEHLTYPRDLRFARMVAFKSQLAEKAIGTYKAAQSDPEHSVFLKNFGTFKVASLSQAEVTADQAVLEMLIDMQREIARIRRQTDTTKSRGFSIDATALRKLIFELINEFKHNNPGCTLKDNDELEKFVGTQLPHFRASQDLKNALEQVINEMELLDKL
jgi:hypothetical protein